MMTSNDFFQVILEEHERIALYDEIVNLLKSKRRLEHTKFPRLSELRYELGIREEIKP
jgi:hypothetical protein